MRRFAPVFLDDEHALGGRVSQTLLRAYNGCPRAGFLYAQTKGAVQTVEMVRGSALHEVQQVAVETMIAQGEASIPPELLKAIVNEVLARYPVPVEEHDYIREMAYRLASELVIDPAEVVACETLVVLELGGWQVRCKVDFAETLPGGLAVRVLDYKTARGAPSFEEISRKRPDETRAAKNVQLVLYGLALVFGRPVRVERCAACDGEGSCVSCGGRGEVEVVEPLPLAGRAERFDLEFVYPGIEDSEGRMLRRPVSLTRLELDEYRESLIATLVRLGESERTGDWPAVVGDMCGECPAKLLCPIPVELRDYRGMINTVEEASEAAERLHRRSDIDKAVLREIKAFAKATGETIPFGLGLEYGFEVRPVEEVRDKGAMWQAVEEAVRYGRDFVRSDHVRRRTSTNFVVRKRPVEEEEVAVDG